MLKKMLFFTLIYPVLSFAFPMDECELPWKAWPDFPAIEIPEWPLELVKVEKVDYEKNKEASFCTRPTDMLDTIVLHHSETPPTWTPQDINQMHLNRSTNNEPWYMIAYSYVINSPYAGQNLPIPVVSEGRPINIVGAHAGGEAFVKPDDLQKKLWDEGQIICGKEGEEFKLDPLMMRDGKIKANITTLGLLITGNYAPYSIVNPGGFNPKKPRYPTIATLELVAKMSCQLQKKYPRIKKIGWHSQYKATVCPGTIKNYVSQIKQLTKRYGCDFK